MAQHVSKAVWHYMVLSALDLRSAASSFSPHWFWVVLVLWLGGCGPRQLNDTPLAAKTGDEKRRIFIPGTHGSLIPPNGFALDTDSIGLAGPDSSRIVVIDLPARSFYNESAAFTRSSVEAISPRVFTYEDIRIAGFPAKFANFQYNEKVDACKLYFGDSTFTLLAVGLYPLGNTRLQEQIRQSLFSFKYDKSHYIDYLKIAKFRINNNKSGFKFNNYSNRGYNYSDSSLMRDSINENIITITSLPYSQKPDEYFAIATQIGLETYGIRDVEIKTDSISALNDYQAHILRIYGIKNNRQTLFYFISLTNDRYTILISYSTNNHFESQLQRFNKFVRAIEFK